MTLYLDTSLLVTSITNEPHAAARVQTWLEENGQEKFAISDWVITEFSAAISIKLRAGKIKLTDRNNSLASFARFSAENCTVLSVLPPHFHTAARFADQHATGLRAGDALHLAVCATHGATLCTLDKRLSQGGPIFGIPTLQP